MNIFTHSCDGATCEANITEISVMSCYLLRFHFETSNLYSCDKKHLKYRIIGEPYGSLWVDTNFGVEMFPAKTDN